MANCNFFLPVIFAGDRLTLHMHGQVYALKRKGVKYLIWKTIKKFGVKLVVSNPAYDGPDFVERIDNVNVFKNFERELECRHSAECEAKLSSKKRDKHLKLDYSSYVEKLKKESCVSIMIDTDYYFYSPSGRLSEAKMFNQTVQTSVGDGISKSRVKKLLSAYGLRFILL